MAVIYINKNMFKKKKCLSQTTSDKVRSGVIVFKHDLTDAADALILLKGQHDFSIFKPCALQKSPQDRFSGVWG